MPISKDREYRNTQPIVPEERKEGAEPTYIVEGYASTFDPYLLYEWDGDQYFERIEPTAFESTDTSDIIMQYDHAGMVMARTSNNTLSVYTDDHGLKVRADLSKTAQARDLYEAIAAGLITKMSFAFTVDAEEFDEATNTRVIQHIKKLYDVSAVSYPANPGTEIGRTARMALDGVITAREQERLLKARREKQLKTLELRLRTMEGEKS